jgi:hypothetical protein
LKLPVQKQLMHFINVNKKNVTKKCELLKRSENKGVRIWESIQNKNKRLYMKCLFDIYLKKLDIYDC